MQELIDKFYLIKLSVKTIYSIIFHYLPFLDDHQTERLKGEEGNDTDDMSVEKKERTCSAFVCLFVCGVFVVLFKEIEENHRHIE